MWNNYYIVAVRTIIVACLTLLSVLQPILALVRCKPDSSKYVFKFIIIVLA